MNCWSSTKIWFLIFFYPDGYFEWISPSQGFWPFLPLCPRFLVLTCYTPLILWFFIKCTMLFWIFFFRWIFWMNFAITGVLAVFVIVPEVFGADLEGTGARKKMLPVEEHYAYNLKVMWDFEGILRYSPIFYGYYSEKEKGAYLNYVWDLGWKRASICVLWIL